MENTFTETSTQSYCSRMGDSCKGICFGILAIFCGLALLVWNEGDAVRTQKALDEAESQVVTIDLTSGVIDSVYEGQLIHATADLSTLDVLEDPVFEVSANSLKMQRQAEMYQWIERQQKETKKNTGGSTTTTTTYEYYKDWSNQWLDSSRYNRAQTYQNPSSMPYESESWEADILFGPYQLSQDLTFKINWFAPLALDSNFTSPIGSVLQNMIYIGNNPQVPEIGDQRIQFASVKAETVSIVGTQQGNAITAYAAENGKKVALLQRGIHTSTAMFDQAQAEKEMQAWALRLIGFIVVYVGMYLIVQPLATATDVLPFLGNFVGTALACLVFPIALILCLIVIAIAWIAYRPIVGGSILAVVVGIGVAWYCFVVKPKQGQTPPGGKPDVETGYNPNGNQYNANSNPYNSQYNNQQQQQPYGQPSYQSQQPYKPNTYVPQQQQPYNPSYQPDAGGFANVLNGGNNNVPTVEADVVYK